MSSLSSVERMDTLQKPVERVDLPKKTDKNALVIFGVVAAALLALSVLFIVLGALGLHGVIPMSPIGGEIMVSLGVAVILGMISGVIRICCGK